jgi:hypothetical protein
MILGQPRRGLGHNIRRDQPRSAQPHAKGEIAMAEENKALIRR